MVVLPGLPHCKGSPHTRETTLFRRSRTISTPFPLFPSTDAAFICTCAHKNTLRPPRTRVHFCCGRCNWCFLVVKSESDSSDACSAGGKGAAAGPSSIDLGGSNDLSGGSGSGSASSGSIESSSSDSIQNVGVAMETAAAGMSPGGHEEEGVSGGGSWNNEENSSGPAHMSALMNGGSIGVPTQQVTAGEQREAGARVSADLEGGGDFGRKIGAEQPSSREGSEREGGRDEAMERARERAGGKDGGAVHVEGPVNVHNTPAETSSERSGGGAVDGGQADAMNESMADPAPSADGGEEDDEASGVTVIGAQEAIVVSAPAAPQPLPAASQPPAASAAAEGSDPEVVDVCGVQVPSAGTVEHQGSAAAGAASALADGNAPPVVQGSGAGATTAEASPSASPVKGVTQEENMESIIDALPPGFVKCPGCPMVRRSLYFYESFGLGLRVVCVE